MAHKEHQLQRGQMDVEAIVGARVRTLREQRGLSQQQMAEQIAAFGWPMHQTTVGKIEQAARPLRLNELFTLASFFDVPMADMWSQPISSAERSLASAPRWRALLRSIEEELPALRERVEALRQERDEATQRWSVVAAELADKEQAARKVRDQLERLEADAGDGDGEHREEA